jgi:dTDP-4-amino-4,6-dideoxygalactose transaminase
MYYLIMPSFEARQRLIAFLRSQGILAVFHYVPLHLSDMGQRFGGRPGQCPVTETVSERLIRLPFYNSLSESEQSEVIETIQRFDDWPR